MVLLDLNYKDGESDDYGFKGIDILKQIRENNPDIPVYIHSSFVSSERLSMDEIAQDLYKQCITIGGAAGLINKPLDFNKTLFGKRVFGAHKTIRGLLIGVLFAGLVGLLQYFVEIYGWIEISQINNCGTFVAFGLLAGLGALLGDAIKSF